MLLDNINLNLLRVFEHVYRYKGMTTASEQLFMTQSGVSQNIKNLEEILGVVLFDRVKKKLIPTAKANQLYEECVISFNGLENVLAELKGEKERLKGKVSIGLPIEFGNNLILPLLAKWGENNPDISFDIRYGHASEMNRLLLTGELNFAFVDTYGLDKQIHLQEIKDETLVLCASKDYLKKKGKVSFSKKYFEGLDYIDYVDDAPILKLWFKHHYKFTQLNLRMRANLMNVHGMSKMIREGLGVGILPLHVLSKLKERGAEPLYQFKGKDTALLNTISIAYLKGRTIDRVIEKTMEFLISNLDS